MNAKDNIVISPVNSLALARIQSISEACLEIWNSCILQRSNKYSWGKADKYSQTEEIQDIQDDMPEYKRISKYTLKNIIKQVDHNYQIFFQQLNLFKSRKTDTKPDPPKTLSDYHAIALNYSENDYTLKNNQLFLRDQDQWLEFTLPANQRQIKGSIAIYCRSQNHIELQIISEIPY